MQLEGTWQDLLTRGFLVARSVFSQAELQEFRGLAEYKAKNLEGKNPIAKAHLQPDPRLADQLHAKLSQLLPVIRDETKLRVNGMSRREEVQAFRADYNLRWHSDDLPFYVHQDQMHYINFWIPLTKPDPEKSGICVIPMDKLQAVNPALFEAIRGKGAVRIFDGKAEYEDGSSTIEAPLGADPDALAVAPRVAEGDMLIVRGDVLHRTQDADTDRLAVSIRAFDLEQPIERARFFTMGKKKYWRLRYSVPGIALSLLTAYKLAGKDSVSVRQLQDLAARRAVMNGGGRPSLREVLAFVQAKLSFPLVMWKNRPADWTKDPEALNVKVYKKPAA